MEIRTLRYFLEIAREGNMSRAAERLHVSQPTLSRVMKELEEELGKQLFTRSSYSIRLTDEGMLLRRRTEDLLDMADKIKDEFRTLGDTVRGDVYIGCAESCLIKYLAKAIKSLREKYPLIKYHIISGDTQQLDEKLKRGIYDFAIIAEPPDLSQYNYIEIPESDVWGVIMPEGHPLAEKQSVTAEDILPYPVFISRQAVNADIPRWSNNITDKLDLCVTFNLANNVAMLVKEGLGLAFVFDRLLETDGKSGITFRPLEPRLETKMYVIWKKYQIFTPAAEALLNEFREILK